MEENQEVVKKKIPFYKRKILMIPLVTVLVMAMVFAAPLIAYFHQTQVDLTVNEARSSADLPVSLTFNSGETVTSDKTIHNNANVQLCAVLSWEEVNNTNNVTYTDNLPISVTLAPGADTIVTTSFTADEVTEAGSVSGLVNYNKIVCV